MHIDNYKVKSKNDFKLSKLETLSKFKQPEKKELMKMLLNDTEKIAALQYKLNAENRQSLLIILQGMDSSGKDGCIEHIMSGVNPQGVVVHSFKHPSDLELDHDYLWRHYQKLPEGGQIAICKRSLERIENKERNWKFSSANIIERCYWDDYQKAYEKAIINTNTKTAPWYIIPADDKWFAHLLIGNIISQELKNMNPAFPSTDKEEEEFMLQASEKLKRESCKIK